MPRFRLIAGLTGNPDCFKEKTVVIAQDIWDRASHDERELLVEDLAYEFLDEVAEVHYEPLPDEES